MSDFSSPAKSDETDSAETVSSETDLAETGFTVRPALSVLKKNGEPCRRILDQLGLSDPTFRPFAEGDFLFLPLLDTADEKLLDDMKNFNDFNVVITRASFKSQKKELTVSGILGYGAAYEMIGDIAVIDDKSGGDVGFNVSDAAAAILAAHPSVQTVLLSAGPVSGEFRTRPLEYVSGVNKTVTVHKEYGCKYKVDLARAYFTPRLSTERHRVLTQIQNGAVVIDMFAGVGPYSIMIAKNASPECVIANDKNEAAAELLRENVVLNKVSGVTVLNLDASDLPDRYTGLGDHIIMNLPQNAAAFLDTAVLLCKKGGVIHYYAMADEEDLFSSSIDLIRRAAEKQNRRIDVIEKRNVRSYAPRQYNICLDVRIL